MNMANIMQYINIFKALIFKIFLLICGICYFNISVALDANKVIFSDKPLYAFRGKTSHITIPISVEYTVAASAWSLPKKILSSYNSVDFTNSSTSDESKLKTHIGYFNHLLCYKYNTTGAYFYPTVILDSSNNCASDSFSGNY